MHFTITVGETTDDGFTLQIPPGFTEGENTIPQGLYYVRHENAVATTTSLAVKKDTGFKGQQLESVECRPTSLSWKGSYQVQFFTMNWKDGKTGDAACQIAAIVPEKGYPVQTWEKELNLKPDLTKTLEERWSMAMEAAESKILEDASYSGQTAAVFPREWNLQWTPVGGRLVSATTPLGVLYKMRGSPIEGEFWGAAEVIEALWEYVASSRGISPEVSQEWVKDCEEYFPVAGEEFHLWNARRR